MQRQLTEGKDYLVMNDGRFVFTDSYLLERGYCCGSGCLNCPYDYLNVPEPKKSFLLSNRIDHERDQNT